MVKKIRKELLQLAIPTTIENLLQTAVGFVDGLIIAKISLTAVTAVGLVNSLMAVYQAIFLAVGIAASSLISRYIGAKKIRQAQEIVKLIINLAIIIGIIIGLITIIFNRSILTLIGASNQVLSSASIFLFWVGGLSVFWSVLTVLGAILRSTGDTRTPMLVSIYVNLFNICLDIYFIFILKMGIAGSGIGTTIARIIGCILLFHALKKTELAFKFNIKTKFSDLKSVYYLTLPAMGERLMMRGGDVFVNFLVIQMGNIIFAANTILETISSFTYMPLFGLATATATLIGQAKGAGSISKIKQIINSSNRYAIYSMITANLLLLIFCQPIVTLFSTEPAIYNNIIKAVIIMLIASPVVALTINQTAALQALGDTKTPFIATTIGMWLVRVLLTYILGIHLELAIIGLWLAQGIDNLWRAILLNYYLKKQIIVKK
ncbi:MULTISPECIES: MATE family efflux transporter [unclassified Enterococcus]|uniref:MATE family efflux transporter n=1 Tax=unclassified Enterococcus TaxID=2608891 RepID=UPI001552E973|nr:MULTISPECIES: MATE family efflux transporter [unclassified Enterococcus]MBS7577770.1 MATE family efflux transporter [Enterococcus sp. MMGLQ5-2]MBS7585030.1 MATE family efflux transporter [Enterococcus sp. MMGLQ5-1]NPD12886.1 MATE family efflux transporter [Enterococcus sp. MMGLQ5-1]NPD37600.1 MATE family efflux transporter [Enterococcus sp. MMGLQ5-2]